MKYKPIRIYLLTSALLLLLCANASAREISEYTFPASEAKGDWQAETVFKRSVISSKNASDQTVLKIKVPDYGAYHLYFYVHHNEKKTWPVLFVEATDKYRKKYEDYVFFEPTWYLEDQQDPGRWMFHAIGGSKPWRLPKGTLTLNITLQGKKSNWTDEDSPLEGKVSLEQVILVPAERFNAGAKRYAFNLIEMTDFTGDWAVNKYTPKFATGVMYTSKPGAGAKKTISLPSRGTYSAALCVYAPEGGALTVNELYYHVYPTKTWQIVDIGILEVSDREKEYELNIINSSSKPTYIGIDYMLLYFERNIEKLD